MKINEEANSINSFEVFDFFFNILRFFKNNKLNFAEVYSLPISVFPIYAHLKGLFYDSNDIWYKLWFK